MSLLSRLVLLVAIALLPSLAIQGWDGVERHRELARASREEALAQTRVLQGDLVGMVDGIHQLLVALSQLPSVQDGDPVGCTAYMRSIVGQFREYMQLAAHDATGDVLCTSGGTAPHAFSNSGRAYYRRAMASDAFAVGDLVTGLQTQHVGVHFALPVHHSDGSVTGLVVASVDQERLTRQVASSMRVAGTLALVMDPSGTVVTVVEDGRRTTEAWVGHPLPDALRTTLSVSRPAVVRATGPGGEPRLFGVLPPDPRLLGMTVAVGFDQMPALADSHRQTRNSLIGIALGAFIALLAAAFGAKRFIVRPLVRLGAAADRVGRGDLAARTELGRHCAEVREVGATFDRMAEALAEREGQRDVAETARRVSDGRYKTLFDAIEVGFCVVEVRFEDGRAVDYRHLEANPAFAAQTGVAEVVGPWASELPPSNQPDWAGIYGRVVETGEPARFEREARALGRWYDVHAFRIDGPDERRIAVLFNDVTERRRAEQDLRDLNANLGKRVAEAINERILVEDALRQSQKLDAVGQLTGGVAHDFNNLLTVLKSSVDLLRRPNITEERRKRYLDAISDTVDRAAKLTGQLLAFSRRQALKPEVFEAGERVRDIADMLDTVTGSRIRVNVEQASEPCHVLADASQFETALVNMAVNARDAMGGEGTLTLRVHDGSPLPPIRGHSGSPGAFVAVSLADTGAGIPPDQLPRIFEPFFTTKGVGKGTGLGLSQVFGFAKQSGGDIDVGSEVGQGTTFTLYLPHVPPPGTQQAAGRRKMAVAGEGQRVLVVEDNVEIGRFATQLLNDLGYRSCWAANADEALAQLATPESVFDVVFTDVVMPGMNGVDLAREIRRRHPDLPVVLTSGYSHVLAEEGPHGFDLVHKPYSADQVSRALRRATAE